MRENRGEVCLFDAGVCGEDRRQARASQRWKDGIWQAAVASNTRLSDSGTFGIKIVGGRYASCIVSWSFWRKMISPQLSYHISAAGYKASDGQGASGKCILHVPPGLRNAGAGLAALVVEQRQSNSPLSAPVALPLRLLVLGGGEGKGKEKAPEGWGALFSP